MTLADDPTDSPLGSEPVADYPKRADMWEASADERERLADERERLADERERLADEREAIADRHERDADNRQDRQPAYPVDDAGDGGEQAIAQARLNRAEAAVRRAEAQLLRARAAATRLGARRTAAEAGRKRIDAANQASAATSEQEQAWLAERRDFVATDRERLANLRDRRADERDEIAADREREADQREHETLQREHGLAPHTKYPGYGPSAALPSPSTRGQDSSTDARRAHEHARATAAAKRQAAARERAAATWGPTAYGPMLLASFAEFARNLFTLDDVDQALLRMLKFTVEAVSGCDWASVTIYRDGCVAQTIASDPVAAQLDTSQLTTALGPAPEALHGEHPVYAPRLVDSTRWPQLSAAATRLGAASSLSHGLFLHQQVQWSVLGVLTLYSATPDRLSARLPRDFSVISSLAVEGAVAGR